MAYPGKKISQLTETASINDSSLIPVVVTPGVSLVTNKITIANAKAVLKGDTGATGAAGDDAYVYIAYASDASGTGFTMTFNANLDYIAVKNSTTAIVSPAAGDFTGLWKKYKGETGADSTVPGPTGPAGADSIVPGPQGDAATATAGTTTTGNPGTTASVVNSGTTSAAVFDFTIPRGDVGATGSTGSSGADGLDVNWLGAYAGGTTYAVNDAVSYNGSSYICKLISTGNLPTDTTYWDLMALKGNDGVGSGDVMGPATNSADYLPQWDGANSKTLKNGIPTSTFAPALGIDDNYVTNAEKTVIGNTSGVNSGDASGHTALAPLANPTFTGLVTTPAIKITTGAGLSKVLTSDADGDATWEAPATSVSVTTKGDLQTFSTVPARLPVGTDGYVLESRASETTGLKWIAPPSSDSMTITSALGTDHTVSGIKTTYVAAVALAFGDLVYYNAGKVSLVDADAIATSYAIAICADATIAQDATGNFLKLGFIRDDTWNWTADLPVYASTTGTTGNTLTQTKPTGVDDVVIVVGMAKSADIIDFMPYFGSIIERT